MSEWKRRSVLASIAAAAGTGSALALGGSNNGKSLSGGTMALSEAFNVSGDLWIGPDSARSNVDANSGRVYLASDTQVQYYGDNGSWTKMGIGSSQEPVPSINTESANIGRENRDWGDEIHLYVYAGQSNALGQGGDAAQAPDPLDTLAKRYDHANDELSPMGAEGNAWSNFAVQYNRAAGKKVCIAGYAQSGSAQHFDAAMIDDGLSHWDPAGNYLNSAPLIQRLGDRIRGALDKLDAEGYDARFGGILWSQGERDSQAIDNGTITKSQYKAALERMIDEFAGETDDIKGGDYPEPWRLYLFQTAHETSAGVGDSSGYQAVREAQTEVADANTRVVMASNRQRTFPDRSLMDDQIHYNQTGLNEMGRVGAQEASAETFAATRHHLSEERVYYGTNDDYSIRYDGDRFRIDEEGSGAKLSIFGNRATWQRVNRVGYDGARQLGVGTGSASSLGIEFNGGAGFYVDGNGNIVAVSEDGTENVL